MMLRRVFMQLATSMVVVQALRWTLPMRAVAVVGYCRIVHYTSEGKLTAQSPWMEDVEDLREWSARTGIPP